MSTRHTLPDGSPKYNNGLRDEESPYLRQHAHNPVDWYPWGSAAFDRARLLDKPIFLSIGYATCHWCHVMEHESFDNLAIADLLNRHFVSIKLDREQRPDIDDIYMSAVQAQTGQGGWPMSSFLTPEGKPFFGGTYFPPQQFASLLENVRQAWSERREDLQKHANELAELIQGMQLCRERAQQLDTAPYAKLREETLASFDNREGGFGAAPKFPHEPLLLLLLDHVLRGQDEALEAALELTLERMARGGIYDQVAGGFHRYSVDRHWLVPHFEKMLYNQAQLLRVYVQAWRLQGKPFWFEIATDLIDYLVRDMRTADGLFYSATDADSEGEEGTFFLWDETELDAILPPGLGSLAKTLYGTSAEGNFEHRNILTLRRSYEEVAAEYGVDRESLVENVREIRQQLYQRREQRERPLRDEKVITSWNAMLITALAEAGMAAQREDWLALARNSAERLWSLHIDDDALWRISLEGRCSVAAVHEDYVHFAEACLALYDATAKEAWLDRAVWLCEQMLGKFHDQETGLFLSSAPVQEVPLIARAASVHDGATPATNGAALDVLYRLARASGRPHWLKQAEQLEQALSGDIIAFPRAHPTSLRAVASARQGGTGIVQWAANGHLRVGLLPTEGTVSQPRIRLLLSVDHGWYLSGIDTAEMAGLCIALGDGEQHWQLAAIAVNELPISAIGQLRDQIHIDIDLFRLAEARWPPRLTMTVQACGNQICLPSERLLVVPAPHSSAPEARLNAE